MERGCKLHVDWTVACLPCCPVCLQGLTEQQVVQQGLRAEVYTSKFTPLKARLAARAEGAVLQQGLVKMLVEEGSGKVLGLHMVGEDAPEIVQVRAGRLVSRWWLLTLRPRLVCVLRMRCCCVGFRAGCEAGPDQAAGGQPGGHPPNGSRGGG